MISGDFATGFLSSRAGRGMAKRRIVCATNVSIRPGCAFALMPREPIQMNATTSSAVISTESKTKDFSTAVTISLPVLLQVSVRVLDEFVAFGGRTEIVHLALI